MRAPFFVELLSRNGDVLQRRQLDGLPIRLGRGYDNDFILDDAHTAAQHAVIEIDAEGKLIIRDLGSRNGTIHLGRRKSSVALSGDTVVRLGHTNLRVRGADFPVAQERADTTMHGWEGLAPALLGLLLIGAVAAVTTWIDDSQPFQAIRYVLAVAVGLVAGLLWSSIWAFANRLFGLHARLGRHLFILGCGLMALAVWKVVSSVAAYAYSMEWLTRYGNHAGIVIVSGIVFLHLCTIKPEHPKRFAMISLILMALGSGMVLMNNLQGSGRLADELYMSSLLPPTVRQSADQNIETFLGEAARLKAGVDADRTQPVKGDGSEAQ